MVIMAVRIGVLALQGSFIEHISTLKRLNIEPASVKLPSQLDELDGLIIPGGESTTIGKLLKKYAFMEKLQKLIHDGFPVYGTCAGTILLAKSIVGSDQPNIGTMDIAVHRNSYGRQIESFEEKLRITILGDIPYRCVFIRAPLIEKAGKQVRILAQLKDGKIVAAEENNMLVTAFHPELTEDLRIHYYFLQKVLASRFHSFAKL
jgi:5'-phosphate synthase pdxT subunit